MNIVLLNNISIDVKNITLFKINSNTYHNHLFEYYDDYYNKIFDSLDKINYIQTKYEYYSSLDSVLFTLIEKHYLNNKKHHNLEGYSHYSKQIVIDTKTKEILSESENVSYYVDGEHIKSEQLYWSDHRVVNHNRMIKLKKLYKYK